MGAFLWLHLGLCCRLQSLCKGNLGPLWPRQLIPTTRLSLGVRQLLWLLKVRHRRRQCREKSRILQFN